MKTRFTFVPTKLKFMIADIKQSVEKKASVKQPRIKVWEMASVTGFEKLFSSAIFLFLITIALAFSLVANHLFCLEKLLVAGLILWYVFVIQFQEHKTKKLTGKGNSPKYK